MVRNCSEFGVNLKNITKRLLANDELVKLLYYANDDPLSMPNLSLEDKKQKIFNKLIKIVPRIGPKEDERSILTVTIVRGDVNSLNTEFRNVAIVVENFVPLTSWIINDSNLRPFAIMGEVQKSLLNKTVNGLGKLVGGDFEINFLTEEIGSYKQTFWVTNYE